VLNVLETFLYHVSRIQYLASVFMNVKVKIRYIKECFGNIKESIYFQL